MNNGKADAVLITKGQTKSPPMVIFVLLTALFSSPFWWLHHATGYDPYVTLLMWCPGLAAVLTLKLSGGSLTALGWRGSHLKWIVLSWAATLGGLFAAYGAVCAMGFASFPEPTLLKKIANGMGMKGAPALLTIAAHAGVSATVGLVNAAGRALGEELGWRGLFVPEACGRFGFLPGSLLVGVVWALWHFPLLLGGVQTAGLINFVIVVTGVSIAYAWFRLKSQSVWPSTVMHGTHNAVRELFLTPLTVATSADANLWLGETGYAMAGMGICIGLIFATVHLRSGAAANPI